MPVKKPKTAARRITRKPRKRAAHSAALTQKRYHELFDALTEGVLMIAADGRVLAANTSAEAMLGMKAREIERALHNDATWRAVNKNGDAFPPHDFPVRKTLRTGKALRNILVGIRLPLLR